MTVRDLRIDPLPGGFRAAASVESEDGPCGELWFEVAGGAAAPPSGMAAGAFLAACLPTAVWREEDLRIDAPVDGELLRRSYRQSQAMAKIHRRERRIRIEAPSVSAPPREGKIVGAAFSGGVDSFHALMSNLRPEGLHPVGALVTGLGFDTLPDDLASHAALMARLGGVSDALGLRHFTVRTNFRPFFRPHADWNRVTHGASIVAFALLLSGELRTLLMPGSIAINRLYRWGTHPLLDGGWECAHLRVVVEGWHIRRNDKLVEIVDWPLALRHLRVCARPPGVGNCGRCEKCLCTQALLELAGAEASEAFPEPLTAERIRRLKVKEVRGLYGLQGILEQARKDPRHAWLADAVRHVVRVTRLHAPRRRAAVWLRTGRASLDPLDQ